MEIESSHSLNAFSTLWLRGPGNLQADVFPASGAKGERMSYFGWFALRLDIFLEGLQKN